MGIRETGYRHWDGTYTSHAFRWWTIAKQGIRATIFNRLRLTFILIFIALVWAPFLISGIFLIASQGQSRDAGFECVGQLENFPTADQLLRCNLYDLLRGWQFLIVPPFIAMVAAPLVSADLRSNALYIYLSKPLRRFDYIVGKMVAVGIWGLTVTVMPALFAWLLALAAQAEVFKLSNPYEILFELLLVQTVFLGVVSMLILSISSFTKNWQASFLSFLGGWLGLFFIAAILEDATNQRSYFLLSLAHNVINFSQDVFEITRTTPAWWPSFLILFGTFAASCGLFVIRLLKIEVAE